VPLLCGSLLEVENPSANSDEELRARISGCLAEILSRTRLPRLKNYAADLQSLTEPAALDGRINALSQAEEERHSRALAAINDTSRFTSRSRVVACIHRYNPSGSETQMVCDTATLAEVASHTHHDPDRVALNQIGARPLTSTEYVAQNLPAGCRPVRDGQSHDVRGRHAPLSRLLYRPRGQPPGGSCAVAESIDSAAMHLAPALTPAARPR